MPDHETSLTLQATPSGKGIEVLAITAGIGNGWTFPAAVLQASTPLWDKAQCYTDHTPGNHSVRDLGGVLSDPQWDEGAQGVRAVLVPTGPAAQVVRDVAEAAIANPTLPIGLSADILMRVDKKTVLEISKVNSLDIVTHPARGGKFIRVLQSEGDPMKVKIRRNGVVLEVDEIEILPPPDCPADPDPAISQSTQNLTKLAAGAQAVVQSLQAQDAIAKLEASNAAAEKLQVGMCQALLQSALAASRLPEPWQARIRTDFKDKAFEPETLQARIEGDRALLSSTVGYRTVQGPSGVTGMVNSADFLEAAVDDLIGATRRTELAKVQTNRLSGIRELVYAHDR